MVSVRACSTCLHGQLSANVGRHRHRRGHERAVAPPLKGARMLTVGQNGMSMSDADT
jgi:hypothetical protein